MVVMNFSVLVGDVVEVLPTLEPNSFDAVLCDPPYGLPGGFMGRSWDRFDGRPVDPAFMHWFAGFTDGEGCFSVHKKNVNGFETYDCQFSIALRSDDRPILERIHRTLGMGTLSNPTAHSRRDGNPQARFCISRKSHCLRLRDLFRNFPLRAKKATDFELWSDALDAWVEHEPREWEEMSGARDRLMANREFKPEGVRVDPYQLWTIRWAREAFRVLKPGGRLLAFGAPRTYHRLAAGLEDAGFIIADQICYLFGQGFPKSLDISKAIDKARDDSKDIAVVVRFLEAARLASGVTRGEVEKHFGTINVGQEFFTLTPGKKPRTPTWAQWLELKNLIGFGDEMDAEVWRLNGRKGKPGESWAEREIIGKGYRVDRKTSPVPITGAMPAGHYDLTAPATPLARRWSGYGTSLKPAWEPCIVAMKPLDGTFAGNAQKWGVAGINVDGGRIGAESWRRPIPENPVPKFQGTYAQDKWTKEQMARGANEQGSTLGRFPANVLLSHTPDCREVGTRKVRVQSPPGGNASRQSGFALTEGSKGYADPDGTETIAAYDCAPECPVRLLDEQSGERKSAGQYRNPGELKNVGERGADWSKHIFQAESNKRRDNTYANETGSASRFFYTAKVSTAEREGADHPTMKPIDLTRYLAKLVLPPQRETPRRLLVPFAGVGSEMIGAILAGWDEVVGIEKDEGYAAKARERIVGTAPLFLQVENVKEFK